LAEQSFKIVIKKPKKTVKIKKNCHE